jgi:vacuolar protein sorting-associated protein 35
MMAVITKVFPDEYHLHTLDMMLSAIGRLNPHVDLKKIVIGLMDRLSSYATRESDNTTSSPESRKQAEEEATARLLARLKLSKTSKEPPEATEAGGPEARQSGTAEADGTTGGAEDSKEPPLKETETNGEGESEEPAVKLPGDIKLYEIFYDQVVNLVTTRGLPIQDTMALLVSLVNLAL